MTNAEEPASSSNEPGSDIQRPRPAKWKVTVVVSLIVVIQIANWVASATLFTLIAKHPMWLIIMQPTTKNLLLVATQLPLTLFFVASVLRRQVPHVLWWNIGRWYGDNGIAWIKKRSPDIGAIIEVLENNFPKYGWLICLLYPHPVVCAMAGASSMRFLPFLVFTFIGIIGYVWAARAGSDLLTPVIDPITHFSSDHFIPLTVGTVLITAVMFWQANRKGTTKIESVQQIEDELDGDTKQND